MFGSRLALTRLPLDGIGSRAAYPAVKPRLLRGAADATPRMNAASASASSLSAARPSVPGAHIVPKKVAETIENSWLKAPLLRPSFVEILAEMENDPHFWDLVSLQNSEEEPNDASVVVDLSV